MFLEPDHGSCDLIVTVVVEQPISVRRAELGNDLLTEHLSDVQLFDLLVPVPPDDCVVFVDILDRYRDGRRFEDRVRLILQRLATLNDVIEICHPCAADIRGDDGAHRAAWLRCYLVVRIPTAPEIPPRERCE